MSLGACIAAAALVAAIGKFLDDHHVQSARKERIRAALIAIFVYLDRPRIPDVPLIILRTPARLFNRFGRWRVLALAVGWAAATVVASVLLVRTAGEADPSFGLEESGLFDSLHAAVSIAAVFARSWVGIAFLIGCGVVGVALVLAARVITARVNAAKGWWTRLAWSAGGGFAVCGFAYSVLLALGSYFGDTDNPFQIVIALFIVLVFAAASLPGVVTAIGPLVVVLTGLIVLGLQRLVLGLVDAASSPRTSPFTYGSALLGLAILAGKLVQEVLK